MYCLICTFFAGMMSGLTVGYNGLNEMEIEAIENAEVTPDDPSYKEIQRNKKLIKRIKPVLSKKHLMLVTLLLCNAAAMEALPVFLDALVPTVVAIILSTTVVLVFGEILPQVSVNINNPNCRLFVWDPINLKSVQVYLLLSDS
jgi:metal transporter CNNM